MRIDKIDLIGFKSFSDKTAFNFHPGVTAVVGPNGCGKSNIIDAFKWVLGEQSAKSLRGDRMEDVIFSGSASKKPKGMAEVTLLISGVSNGNSSELGEISVTRRLYRSGESEYLMNKVPCRLKDIRNVFLDTGLELKTYSILEQGRIDAILNSKPHDRRFLIEEVAGVMKYNVRKAEAINKLEASQSNLQRLQDIISEVKRQINSIDRHAKRAQRYKRLFDEVRDLEVKIAIRNISQLGNELADISSSDEKIKSRETELSTNIHSSDALLEEKKLLLVNEEKSYDELHNRLNAAEIKYIEEEGRISLLKSDCENLKGRLQRLFVRDNELTAAKENMSSQVEELKKKIDGINLELSGVETALNSRNEAFSAREREIVEIERSLEDGRRKIFDKAEEVSGLKNEINGFSLVIETIGKKEQKCFEDINTVKKAISELSDSIAETTNAFNSADTGLQDNYKKKQTLTDELNRQKEALTLKEERLYKDREEMAAMNSRAGSLRELDNSGKSSVKDSVKILCQVADIFEALPEHETAIESVLGDRLSAAVVDNDKEIKKALDLIKQHKINRSGFIPVNIFTAFSGASPAVFSGSNVIGSAVDFVKVRKGFEKIAAALLNDVILVNDLNTAFDLWLSSISSASTALSLPYFVTLEGEVLEPSGIVFGGTEKGVLKIKRELRELEQSMEKRKSDISSAEDLLTTMRKGISDDEKGMTSLEAEIAQIEKGHHELNLKNVSLNEGSEREQNKLEFISAELDGERKEKEIAVLGLGEKGKACKVLEDERRVLEDVVKENLGMVAEKRTLLNTLRSELTEIMLSRTAGTEKKDSLIRELERLDSEIAGIEIKNDEMAQEKINIETESGNKENEIKGRSEAVASQVTIISSLKQSSSELKEKIEAKAAELNILEKQQRQYADELSKVRKELSHIEVKKTELTLKRDHIREDIKKIYSVDVDNIFGESVSEPLLPEQEQRLGELREKLQAIGPVNLGTLEELEELRTRYEFLTKQQNDLLESITSLQETISKINRTTQKKMEEAFQALNEKFKEVFTSLFGKGRAELILTESNILDAGIEIIAQPPGKKLQNLMLLSGGEKALTALSLLFAGFMIKPTPMCLLDEVDAPLDESNTDRFTSLLRKLSKNIQFIIITHNRRTMEVADYLYGVTMEEPGISKVVSMHLAEVV